jgi:lysozyme
MANVFKEYKAYLPYIAASIAIPALLVIGKKVQAATGKATVPHNNLKAFLTMIQYAEGTYGQNAYRTLYGGQLFRSYKAHPNIVITKSGIASTAAGAYQILYRTWASVQGALQLPDFSPASQNRAAIELIRRRGALQDVLAGRFSEAVEKCKKEWASLPGAGYGQRERSLALLNDVYKSAGGQVSV